MLQKSNTPNILKKKIRLTCLSGFCLLQLRELSTQAQFSYDGTVALDVAILKILKE